MSNEIAKSEEMNLLENTFDNASKFLFSTFNLNNQDEKLKAFKHISNPDHRLKDFINMDIAIKDIYIESVMIVKKKEESGEVELDDDGNPIVANCPRCIIIDDKGESYACTSFGMFNVLKRILEMLGNPREWEKPIKFKVKQVSVGANRNILTLVPILK